jgi:N-acetylmuramoyl-L-alanine amidase
MTRAPIARPSPNHGARPNGAHIDLLILHYTGMPSAEAAMARLCDPASVVSAHYAIDEDGTLYVLVDEARRAWHAGVGFWAGATDVNDRSIGIELVNPGHEFGYRPFPEPQMQTLESLGRDIVARHRIPPHRVLGHSDVAPNRKQDPGELFDWPRLARAGLGIWPRAAACQTPPGVALSADETTEAQALLDRFGYGTDNVAATIAAFQRHFRPAPMDGVLDRDCLLRLRDLLAQR